MARITITEALAELKTIDKRIEKKREFVLTYLLRQEMFKDPLEKEGGSVSAIRRELQAVGDLEERKVAIRRAVQKANELTTVTIGRFTRSVADWLVWRRDVSPGQSQLLTVLRTRIDGARREAIQRGGNLSAGGDGARSGDVIVNVNEQELARDIETLEEILGTLDGQLSLKNATTVIDV